MSDATNTTIEQLPGTTQESQPSGVIAPPADQLPEPTKQEATPPAGNAPEVKEPVVVQFEPTGNPALDLTLGFLGKLGFDSDHAAMKLADTGDFSLLKAELALMGDKAKGWEQVIAVGEQAFATVREQHEAQRKVDRENIVNAAGGEDAWNEVKTWAATAVDDKQRGIINRALGEGGLVAEAMAAYLANQYNSFKSGQPQGKAVVDPTSPVGGGTAINGPLTAQQFREESSKLQAKLGYNYYDSAEYRALQDRRRAGMTLGS